MTWDQWFYEISRFYSGPGLIPGVTDYDEACKMHLTPGVVHNFPKAVDV